MISTLSLFKLMLGTFVSVLADVMDFAFAKGDHCLRRANGTVGVIPECIGVPDQQTINCPVKDSSSKTVHVGVPVSVDFNNTSGDEVSLYWVSDVGVDILQKTILPWKTTTQDTFMGHVFRIKHKNGQTLLEHVVGLIPLHEDQGAHDSSKLAPSVQADKNSVGAEVTFVNRAASVLNLFFYNPNGKLELVSQMEPNTAYPQFTYKGHQFLAQTSEGRPVTSYQVRDIVVPSCVDQPRVDRGVDSLCPSCDEKQTRAGRLKIRDYQETAKATTSVLKVRRLSLSRRDEL